MTPRLCGGYPACEFITCFARPMSNDTSFGLPVPSASLALQRLYHLERTAPDRIAFTQPMGGGVVKDLTWKEIVGQARRLAGHLQAQGFPAGSKIALLSKNTAWWLVCDYAIWMAGHVSVPLYPTLAAETIRQILEHSESKLLFVGKLDGFEGMKAGIPAGLPCIATPQIGRASCRERRQNSGG